MNVVAHEDDDLLFMNPSIRHLIAASTPVRTVFLTAGDFGGPPAYWQEREQGILAAYALMAGVENVWRQDPSGTHANHADLPSVHVLVGRPAVSVVFLRLPDGGPGGRGFSSSGRESLAGLWSGALARVHPVDGVGSFDRSELIDVLGRLMTAFHPTSLHVQDCTMATTHRDHSDHHVGALFALAAQQKVLQSLAEVIMHRDYTIAERPSDLSGEDAIFKWQVFSTYAQFDRLLCPSADCPGMPSYQKYGTREYFATVPTRLLEIRGDMCGERN